MKHVRCAVGILAGLVLLAAAAIARGQTRDTASVAGTVRDATGAAVPGAEVELKNSSIGLERHTQTDAEGKFAITGLPLTGEYALAVRKSGFGESRRSRIELRAGGTAVFGIVLSVSAVQSVVTVYGTVGTAQTDSAQLETRLDLEKIDATPVFGRKLTALPLLDSAVRPARGTGDIFLNEVLYVINGSGRRQTSYSLDDGTGDDNWGRQTLFTTVPLTAVQEFTVLTSALSAEYGWSTGSAVNLVTKSGTNRFHGDMLFLGRPVRVQARTPLAPRRTGDQLWQGSGELSGPIRRDRTYFLVSAERNNQNRGSLVTSPLDFGDIFTGEFRQDLVLARLDRQLSQKHLLMVRANFDRFSDTNPADSVGGLNLRSAARSFARRTYAAEISETASFSTRLANEARLQFQLGSPITQFVPVTPSTQFVYPGVATAGESRSASLLNHQYEFADTVSWAHGKHSLRFGTDVVYSSSGGVGQEFGGGLVLGQFRVGPSGLNKPVSQLTLADVTSFTQSFGNASYHVGETNFAAFVQDGFSATSALMLNLGLRYEVETFSDDRDNVAPRVGFAYKLPRFGTTVLRGSYGIYYSDLRANLAADYSINGPSGIFSFSAQPGQLGFPTLLGPLPAFPPGAVLPPRDITVRVGQAAFLSQFFNVSNLRFYPDGLLNPYTQQWTLGVQRELGPRRLLSIDYVGSHTLDIERPVDLNAPAPFVRTAAGQVRSAAAADATRPNVPVPNGYRRIVAQVNAGAVTYNGLQVNLSKRFSRHFSMLLSYAYSHTIGTVEPDVPQQDPNDSNFLSAAEKATSVLDQRHRAVLSGWYEFPWQLSVGSSISLASSRPFNVTTGVDNNGDGSFADRPVINGIVIPRNFGQGTPVYDVSMFLQKEVRFSERVGLSLRGEAFNFFNHANIVGRNGVYGNLASGLPVASFGQPLGGVNNVDPGREFQFSARLRF